MEHWKTMIQKGNRHFEAGQWIEAREVYLQALAWAQTLFERWGDPDQAVAALVVSYHNLGDLHLQLGQPEETAEYLCASHRHLLKVADDLRLPSSVREAALRHSRHTHLALMQFIREQGTYPATERLLKKSTDISAEHSGNPKPSDRYLHH